ncbi:MAG: RDD family protein [Niabella sp.]
MEEKYPLLIDRIQSTFIDMSLIIALMFAFTNILDKFDNIPDWVRIILFVGLFLVYEPLCMTLGATVGNYVKGIRVRKDTDTTKRINIFQAIIRYIVKTLLGWVSFLTINMNPKRRAIHDFVSGSVMIKLQKLKDKNSFALVEPCP